MIDYVCVSRLSMRMEQNELTLFAREALMNALDTAELKKIFHGEDFERAHLAGLDRQLKHTEHLMTALVVLEGDGLTVGVPLGGRDVILVLKKGGSRFDDAPCGQFDNHRHTIVQRVARLGILLFVEQRLHAIGW